MAQNLLFSRLGNKVPEPFGLEMKKWKGYVCLAVCRHTERPVSCEDVTKIGRELYKFRTCHALLDKIEY
jgi:hypothetical protein